MRKGFLGVALSLSLTAGPAAADVLAVPEAEPVAARVTTPAKGISMADVEKQFGEPRSKQPTVGGGSPKQPPITRWDYAGFSVIFEHDKVVDTVVPGAPPRIHHKEQLRGGDAAYVPPPAAPPMPAPEEMPPAADTALMPTPGPDAPPAAAEPTPAPAEPSALAPSEAAAEPPAEATETPPP